MGNIIDYVKWRGDLLFSERPLNEIDNLIFCEMAYARMERYIDPYTRITLLCAAMECYSDENFDEDARGARLLRELACSPRFKNLEVYNIETKLDETTQFAAVCIDLPNNETYIAFRGTDDTIIGWREDFAISYCITPAQQRAVEYLKRNVTDKKRKYIIGGHSKGGNLALYASLMLPVHQQALIKRIYNNDGPGIPPERLDYDSYERIKDKVYRISPAHCVVGHLFEMHDIKTKYVKSSFEGIKEHDAISWEVIGDRFVVAPGLSQSCRLINEIFYDWIESVSQKERERFTKEFFDALEKNGADTMAEVFKSNPVEFVNIFGSVVGFDKNSKAAFKKLVASAARNVAVTASSPVVHTISKIAEKIRREEGQEAYDEFGVLIEEADESGVLTKIFGKHKEFRHNEFGELIEHVWEEKVEIKNPFKKKRKHDDKEEISFAETRPET